MYGLLTSSFFTNKICLVFMMWFVHWLIWVMWYNIYIWVAMVVADCLGLIWCQDIGNHDDHDDVIKCKHFPHYWPFVQGIHRSPVNSPHKGQWRGALMFSLMCTRINGWVNNGEAGDLRHHRAHYDVTSMTVGQSAHIRSIPKQCMKHHDTLNNLDNNIMCLFGGRSCYLRYIII